MIQQFVFVFEVEGVAGTLTVNDWAWVNIPEVDDFIYLHDFLEKENENISISVATDKLNYKNINTALVKYKFKITEKMFVKVTKDVRHLEYKVAVFDK